MHSCSFCPACHDTVKPVVTPEWKNTDGRLAARCAAVASVGAAVIHFAVMPMHWRDWVPSGIFFVALALFQLGWAFLAWSRPTVWVLAAGVAANTGAAALWVTACTAGAPFGPSAGQPEAVGTAGISVMLLQVYVIMGAGWAWFRGYEAEEVSGFNRAMVLLGANAVMIGAVTVGLASSFVGHHHQHGGAVEMQAEPNGAPAPKMESHHPLGRLVSPGPEQGLPITDMGLDTGAGQPQSLPVESAAPAHDGHDGHHGD